MPRATSAPPTRCGAGWRAHLAAVEAPGAPGTLGGSVLSRAVERAHPRRPHQFRRRNRAQGHLDQLLRAAGRRQHLHTTATRWASMPRSTRPRKPCAAAAAWVTTSPASGRAAPRSKVPTAAPAGRCRTCACSTSPARPSSRQARAAGRRWPCCAAIIPTWKRSFTPRTKAACATSTCRWPRPTRSCRP